MKKANKILILLLLCKFTMQAQGIQFEKTNWKETLEKATQSNKLVFVDAYTTWCGPCKMLSRNTFPDSAVGAFFNHNFINAKVDMEKGDGPELAQRYAVTSYPTLLFVDGKGEIVHRAVGYHLPEQLLELGRNALNPEAQIGTLEKRYSAGERNATFLMQYLSALSAAYDPQTGIVANKYLATQTDFSSEKNMEIIARYADDAFSPAFLYMVNNRPAFDERYGLTNIDARIQGVFDQHLQINPELNWPEIDQLILKVFPKNGAEKSAYFKMNWFRNKEDVNGFLEAADHFYNTYPSDNPDELNEVAWIFYKNTTDKKYLKMALKWAQKSVSLFESYYNLDTVASLQAKLGKKKDAIITAKKAIELAKKSGDDYSQTQQLLYELETQK